MALQSAENCTCARQQDDVKERKKEKKSGLSDGRLSLWSYFDHNAIRAIRKIPNVKAPVELTEPPDVARLRK